MNLFNLFVVNLFLIMNASEMIQAQNDPINQHYRYTNGVPISLQGYKLDGFHYKVINSMTMIGCGQRCLAEFPKCRSYNYYVSMGEEFCELNSRGVSSAAEAMAGSLQKDPNCAFVQVQTVSMKYPSTCADHYKSGVLASGLYYIRDHDNRYYRVFCDFHSEPNKVWTLVDSFIYKNRLSPQFYTVPFFMNDPVNENEPNWESYRLSLPRMQHISTRSTHWRITCNFPQDGLRYTDYVRAKIASLDIVSFNDKESCKHMEYIHVINHNCSECTAAWWQFNDQILHHDMTAHLCDFGPTAGAVNSQDVFGFYVSVNTKFRCCNSDTSSTNFWFGCHV